MPSKKDSSGSVSLMGHAKVKAIKKEPAYKSPAKSNGPTISPVEYTVEKIIGKRFWNGRPQLRIKWLGYPEEESTWEPQENMGKCIELLTDFEAELHKKQMKQEAIIKTERLDASSVSPKKKNKNKSSPKLYTSEIDEANLLIKMDKLQIKANSSPLKRKAKQEVKLFPATASKTAIIVSPLKPKAKQEIKLSPEMSSKTSKILSPLKRAAKQEVKLSPEMDSKSLEILSPLKRKAKQEIKLSPETASKTCTILSPLNRKTKQELSPELDSKSFNTLSSPKRKAKEEFIRCPVKAKKIKDSYEHRSFLNLSSDSSDNGETIPLKQETEKPLKQSMVASDKASGAPSPSLNVASKHNSLEFIKEQARKWRGKKGKQHQKLRDTPTSRPGKLIKPRNLDESIQNVMKSLHGGTHTRQQNLPNLPNTPKCEPNLEDNYSINRSGNKRKMGEPWRVSPRMRKYPYGLARGRPLDKVIHHFKMGEKLFLFVNWQGMSITDVLLLDDLIDIYPQQIINYMETCKVVMPYKN